jgi:hypothetical protein
MSEDQTKDKILELIEWIDSHEKKLFGPFHFFISLGGFFVLFLVIVFVVVEFVFSQTASATDRISIALASAAVLIASVSIVIQTGERDIVDGCFYRALELRRTLGLREFDDTEKILLKALIKVRSKNDQLKLRLVYERNKKAKGDMFSEKKLLEKLYE